MLRLGISILLCATVVSTQTKYCCTPVQWESVNYISDGRVAKGSTKPDYTEGTELTSVDGINHKIASMSTLHTAGLNITIQIIQLFDKNVQYTINSGECKQSSLPNWQQPCIPDNATLVKQTYYGAGNNKIDVDVYSVNYGPNQVYVTMSSADCTPVAVSAYGSTDDVSAMSAKVYTNITMGIKDTSIFIVPTICNNATVVPEMPVKRHF